MQDNWINFNDEGAPINHAIIAWEVRHGCFIVVVLSNKTEDHPSNIVCARNGDSLNDLDFTHWQHELSGPKARTIPIPQERDEAFLMLSLAGNFLGMPMERCGELSDLAMGKAELKRDAE